MLRAWLCQLHQNLLGPAAAPKLARRRTPSFRPQVEDLGSRVLPSSFYDPLWWDLGGGVEVDPTLTGTVPGWDMQGSTPTEPVPGLPGPKPKHHPPPAPHQRPHGLFNNLIRMHHQLKKWHRQRHGGGEPAPSFTPMPTSDPTGFNGFGGGGTTVSIGYDDNAWWG